MLHHTQYNGNYGLYFRFWDRLCGTELKATDPLFAAIHARGPVEIVDNTRYRPLAIERLVRETADTVSVYLATDDPRFLDYRPGQHLTIRARVHGRTFMRVFSLSSTPGLDEHLRITVKRNGPVSHWLLDEARVGDTIVAQYPTGDFVPEPGDAPMVMIAGGSGITPLMSMIRHTLVTQPERPVTLLYANRSRDAIIFKRDLDRLAAEHADFTYRDFVSGERRLGIEDLRPPAEADRATSFYLCGPDGLKDVMRAHLSALGVPPVHVHTEHYAEGYVPWFGLTTPRVEVKAGMPQPA